MLKIKPVLIQYGIDFLLIFRETKPNISGYLANKRSALQTLTLMLAYIVIAFAVSQNYFHSLKQRKFLVFAWGGMSQSWYLAIFSKLCIETVVYRNRY